MPRIENIGSKVSEWSNRTGNGSSAHDVCARCYKQIETNPRAFDTQLDRYNGDPPGEEWGGDVVHPPYEEEDYACAVCDRQLGKRDNGNI